MQYELLALPTSSKVPYELLALVFMGSSDVTFFLFFFSSPLAGYSRIIPSCLRAHFKDNFHT